MVLDLITNFATMLDSEAALAFAFLGLTTAVMAFGVPWVLLPISFSSGMLLGGRVGIAVMLVGAVLGSQALFVVARRWLAVPIRKRFGHRLERFDGELAKRGFWYLIGLRLIGAPHLLVSSACALSPLKAGRFALATLIGLAPAIVLSATAGSIV
ncbi:MAG: VTT domain-containing protein [Croceibacterium sp.]